MKWPAPVDVRPARPLPPTPVVGAPVVLELPHGGAAVGVVKNGRLHDALQPQPQRPGAPDDAPAPRPWHAVRTYLACDFSHLVWWPSTPGVVALAGWLGCPCGCEWGVEVVVLNPARNPASRPAGHTPVPDPAHAGLLRGFPAGG